MEQVDTFDLKFLDAEYAIQDDALFRALFGDDGETLYIQVLNAGLTELGRELTGAEADHIYSSLRRQFGADK